jgi:hypothetical protein
VAAARGSGVDRESRARPRDSECPEPDRRVEAGATGRQARRRAPQGEGAAPGQPRAARTAGTDAGGTRSGWTGGGGRSERARRRREDGRKPARRRQSPRGVTKRRPRRGAGAPRCCRHPAGARVYRRAERERRPPPPGQPRAAGTAGTPLDVARGALSQVEGRRPAPQGSQEGKHGGVPHKADRFKAPCRVRRDPGAIPASPAPTV